MNLDHLDTDMLEKFACQLFSILMLRPRHILQSIMGRDTVVILIMLFFNLANAFSGSNSSSVSIHSYFSSLMALPRFITVFCYQSEKYSRGKQLSMFNIIRFPNDVCQATSSYNGFYQFDCLSSGLRLIMSCRYLLHFIGVCCPGWDSIRDLCCILWCLLCFQHCMWRDNFS